MHRAPRLAIAFGLLALGALPFAGCDSGVGCAGKPTASTQAKPPAYQPASRPSSAQVTVGGRTASLRTQSTQPVDPYAPAARPVAPTTKAPPPPRRINGVWRYSNTPQFLDEYLAGKTRSRSRVRLTGKVKRGIDMGQQGGYRLWLDAGRRRFVEARFRDNGRAAMSAREGRVVTVDCQPTAKIGTNARLEDCELR